VASYTYGKLTVPVTADTRELTVQIKGAATAAGTDAAGHVSSAFTRGLASLGGLAASVGKSVATGLTVATGAATAFGVEAFKSAARVGEMDASLRALAKANNLSYDDMQRNVTAIRKQGIEANVAQELVAQFARNQLDLGKSTDLARVAQDMAVISGRNSTDVLADLTHGIVTQNTQVLRNAGANVQAGKAIDDYAKSVGKSVKDLTDSERAQAVLNAVLAEGKNVAGAYSAAMEEPGKVLRSFKRVTDDIKISVGQGLLQAFGPLILQAYDLTKAFSAAVAPGGALAPIFDAIGVAVGKLVEPLTGIIASWAKWIEGLKPEQISRVADLIKQWGPLFIAAAGGLAALVAPSLLGQIPVLGGLLSTLMGPVTMVGGGIAKLGGSALAAVPGLGSMGSAAGLLPAAMNPVGLAIAGVVAAVGAMLVASKDFRGAVIELGKVLWDTLKPALSAVWELVKVFGKALWEILGAIGDALAPALRNLAPLLRSIGELFGIQMKGGAEGAGGAMTSIVPAITGVIKVIGFLLDVTTKVLVPIIEIPVKLAILASKAASVVQPLKLMGQAIEWLIGVVSKLWHWITGNSPGLIPAFGALGSAASSVAGLLSGAVASAFSGLVSVVSSATSAISGAVSGTFSQMQSVVSGAMGQIQGAVSSGFSSMTSVAKSAGSSMIDGLKSGLEGARSLGGWIGNNVTGPVTGFLKKGLGIGSPSTITIVIGEEMIDGLKQGLEKARQAGSWIADNVTGPIVGWLKKGLGIGSPSTITIVIGEEVIEGLKRGLASAGDLVSFIKSDVCAPIIDTVKKFFKIGSPSRLMMGVGEDLRAGLEEGFGGGDLDLGAGPHITSPLAAPGLAAAAGTLPGTAAGPVINVYPQAGQDERQIAAMVSRELAWATAGGVS
jgi:phage-related protein